MYKKYYQRFLQANPSVQHYAAHSHHYWPDVTRDATLQYWDDSAKYVDDKWTHFFTEKIPATQKLIADVLNLSKSEQIVFAPNTHEFVCRLFSCFDQKSKIKVLTTDSEFHSFDRQLNRFIEADAVQVDRVQTVPFATFESRLIQKIEQNDYDIIFISQVFYNSGFAIKNLNEIVKSVKSSKTLIVIDGYHGFMALPTDLSEIESRVFYIAGSYKYAQGGEGCCFMHVPVNCELRPSFTGWFAGFADLSEKKAGPISYSTDGMRFAGSTMDFSALYRLNAVLTLFKKDGLTSEVIHKHIQKLQQNFLAEIRKLKSNTLSEDRILKLDYAFHGHFFAFKLDSVPQTKETYDLLNQINIKTDFRGDRLRFGFGLYQNENIDLSAFSK